MASVFADVISKLITVELLTTCDGQVNENGIVSASSSTEFSSPLHCTPLFRSLAAGIPSPKFSESVSHLKILVFLLNTDCVVKVKCCGTGT